MPVPRFSWGDDPSGSEITALMQSIEGKRVAALIGDGFEEAEFLEPRLALEQAGAVVTIVGVEDSARTRIRSKRGLDDGQMTPRAEELAGDVTADDFDALLIPGGFSPDRVRMDRDAQRLVREFDAAKKPIFMIGRGPQVVISAQLARGRTLTGFPSIADDIRNAGGLYRDQPVVADGNWVSSRHPADLPQFNRAIVEKLASAIAAAAP